MNRKPYILHSLSECVECGERDFDGPNVEAYELDGELVCEDCADDYIERWEEDNDQFGVVPKSPDPGRDLALMMLQQGHAPHGATLETAIRWAFDQLTWHRNTSQLDALLNGLRASLDEEQPS